MAKIKQKTNRAAAKRYKVTATGKIKRTKANRRHRLATKTNRQKSRGAIQDAYADKSCEKNISKLLPYKNK